MKHYVCLSGYGQTILSLTMFSAIRPRCFALSQGRLYAETRGTSGAAQLSLVTAVFGAVKEFAQGGLDHLQAGAQRRTTGGRLSLWRGGDEGAGTTRIPI